MSGKKRKVRATTPCEEEGEDEDVEHQVGSEQEDEGKSL
jgi:hypothetical protein